MSQNLLRRISSIGVKSLFGMFDYELDVSADGGGEQEKIVILYGDNGSGKSTLLKLAFNMIAPDQGSGHKTYLLNTEFQSLVVRFNDGTIVQAGRTKGNISGPYSLKVKRSRKKQITAKVQSNRAREHDDLHMLVEPALKELGCALYLLSDDRAIHRAGAGIKRSSVRDERRYIEENGFLESQGRLLSGNMPETPEDISKKLLESAIKLTEEWFRRRIFGSGSRGDSGVNELYAKILKRLSETGGDETKGTTKKQIESRINKLSKESKNYSKYGLLSEFDSREILSILKGVDNQTYNVIVDVLSPYLDSIETKNYAMEDIYERIDTFVTVAGKFYTNKSLSYDLREGIRITSSSGKVLEPSMLSSGERHLLLLFCTSIVTGGAPSILMIDEPEISLNIKWQRMLIDALMQCIGDNDIQFIFSTHSLEILAKHKSRVVKLENTRG
ncbi:MAG: AAA family ATPase [Candidatus Thiodiazotropha sp. L084R]